MSTRRNPHFWSLTIPASGLPVDVLSWLLSICSPQFTKQYYLWELSSFLLMMKLKLALRLQTHSHQMMIFLLLCMAVFEREEECEREKVPSYM